MEEDQGSKSNNIIWLIIVPIIIGVILLVVERVVFREEVSEIPPTTEVQDAPGDVFYSVYLRDQEDRAIIRYAQLTLEIGDVEIRRASDLEGKAIFTVAQRYQGQSARLRIEIEGEENDFIDILLPSEDSSKEVLINTGTGEIAQVSEQTPTKTATSVPTQSPTAVPTGTNTPVPTAAPIVEPTNTAVPTIPPSPTPTEMPSEGNMLIVVAPVEVPVNIYTRDSDVTGAPRGRVSQGDVLEILDLNDDGDWYYVLVVKNGIEAWIQNDPNIVVPFDGEPPVISQDPVSEEQPVASGCLQVTITRIFKSNDIFDDVVLNWSNIPADATRAQLSVSGPTVSGETKLVVQPTFNDLKSSYTVQQWMFEAGNFSFNATYRYTVRVLAGSSEICTVTGTFEQ